MLSRCIFVQKTVDRICDYGDPDANKGELKLLMVEILSGESFHTSKMKDHSKVMSVPRVIRLDRRTLRCVNCLPWIVESSTFLRDCDTVRSSAMDCALYGASNSLQWIIKTQRTVLHAPLMTAAALGGHLEIIISSSK